MSNSLLTRRRQNAMAVGEHCSQGNSGEDLKTGGCDLGATWCWMCLKPGQLWLRPQGFTLKDALLLWILLVIFLFLKLFKVSVLHAGCSQNGGSYIGFWGICCFRLYILMWELWLPVRVMILDFFKGSVLKLDSCCFTKHLFNVIVHLIL